MWMGKASKIFLQCYSYFLLESIGWQINPRDQVEESKWALWGPGKTHLLFIWNTNCYLILSKVCYLSEKELSSERMVIFSYSTFITHFLKIRVVAIFLSSFNLKEFKASLLGTWSLNKTRRIQTTHPEMIDFIAIQQHFTVRGDHTAMEGKMKQKYGEDQIWASKRNFFVTPLWLGWWPQVKEHLTSYI